MSANKYYLSHLECEEAAERMAGRLAMLKPTDGYGNRIRVYPVPRGGVPVAYLLSQFLPIILVEEPAGAQVFVDDLIDSGKTSLAYHKRFPEIPFEVLFNKGPVTQGEPAFVNNWLVFPWEARDGQSEDDTIIGTLTNHLRNHKVPFAANDCIADALQNDEIDDMHKEVVKRSEALLRALLIDIDNDHNTHGTARRFADMLVYETMRGRYFPPPKITEFPNAKNLDEVYAVGPISLRSMCSHHLQPIIGKAWIGVLPDKRLIGLSKFVRVLRWIAARPQIQEEMVIQIADKLQELCEPKGLAVVIKASHGCMTCRGVREADDCEMVNSVMRGAFRTKPEARAEFLSLIK